MNILQKIRHILFDDRKHFFLIFLSRFSFLFPDKLFLRILFKLKVGYPLDLNEPRTFNEKLQWLKLYNRRSEYTQMVDKYAVKEYVAQVIGKECIIPTIGVWNKFGQIDFSALPERFVLKTTHGGGGGGVAICNDKAHFDTAEAKRKLEKSLSVDIYRNLREWPYKNVKRRIIAEEYMQDGSGELKDYKFFCFNGRVEFFKIDFDRFVDHHANYFDRNGKLLPFGEADLPPVPDKKLEIPHNIQKMIVLAEKLSAGIPFLRVDLYNVNGKIYFGELTFFPASGFGRFAPSQYDYVLGNYIKLPEKYRV